jgi:hypothetical protein
MIGRAVFSTFVFALISTSADAQERPSGLHCNLKVPPKEAGEEHSHGVILRIFPRAKDIASTYSGCQTLFAPDKDSWVIVAMTEVIKGDPVRIWSEYETDPNRLACRYAKGKVVRGDREQCPDPEYILAKSMAPGCVQRIRKIVEKNGLGTPLPRACAYE